jgi:signal transduction histidine kinase
VGGGPRGRVDVGAGRGGFPASVVAMSSVDPSLVATRRQLSAFRDVAHAVGSRLELDALLEAIIRAVCTVLGSERAGLFLLDESTGEVVSRVTSGHEAEIRVAPGKGIVGAVLASGEAIRLDDAWADPRFHRGVDETTGFRTRTLLAVPLRDRDGALKGVVEALNKVDGVFDDEDEQLLAALGAELATALQRARLYDELSRKKAEADRRVQELDLLVEIDRALLAADGVQAVLDVVVERARALLPAAAASVAVLNPRTSALVFRSASGVGDDRIVDRAIPADMGFAGLAFAERCTVRVDDASRDPRHLQRVAKITAFEPGPLIVAPLLVPRTDGSDEDERVLGVITVLRAQNDPPFSASDERLVNLIGNRVAFAIDVEERKEKARAKDRLESMGRMLAGIIHDFRTPMTVIAGYVQLMATTESAEERQQNAEMVMQSTEQMSAMIRELLAFARGDSEVLLRKVWIENFMRDCGEVLRRLVPGDAIDLVIEVRSQAAVRIDDLKLKRALANLVRNAREALEQQPPAQGRGRIEVTVTTDGDVVVVRVADNGPGLPAAIEERLFQEFATWGKAHGTGLGLALVKRIVDEHQGTVVVDNTPGAGCAFQLRLPRA